MSTLNRSQLRPQYPVFSERGYTPKPAPFGPPDMWPSAGGSGYSVYASAHGRNLAGVDDMNAEGIDNYPNELNTLAAADDVAGNGVFDPNDTHGNVHPDEGVFADHQSLPGYVDRDQFYTPSEVNDIPGGGKVMYVPGGAVAFQQGQTETLRKNQLLWEIPPSVRPFAPPGIQQSNTIDAPTPTESIRGLGEMDAETKKKYTMMVTLGVCAGLGYLVWKSSKK